MTFKLGPNIVFWDSKSYYDNPNRADYPILTFKILFWYLNWGQISYFDIKKLQHGYVLKKVEFWHLDPQCWLGGVCWQNISYHVAAFVIPFHLICNMTMFWRSWILSFWPHPLSLPRESDRCLWSKITFDMFHNYRTSICMRQLSKKCWRLTELLQN